jgi:hypothetical protein
VALAACASTRLVAAQATRRRLSTPVDPSDGPTTPTPLAADRAAPCAEPIGGALVVVAAAGHPMSRAVVAVERDRVAVLVLAVRGGRGQALELPPSRARAREDVHAALVVGVAVAVRGTGQQRRAVERDRETRADRPFAPSDAVSFWSSAPLGAAAHVHVDGAQLRCRDDPGG